MFGDLTNHSENKIFDAVFDEETIALMSLNRSQAILNRLSMEIYKRNFEFLVPDKNDILNYSRCHTLCTGYSRIDNETGKKTNSIRDKRTKTKCKKILKLNNYVNFKLVPSTKLYKYLEENRINKFKLSIGKRTNCYLIVERHRKGGKLRVNQIILER